MIHAAVVSSALGLLGLGLGLAGGGCARPCPTLRADVAAFRSLDARLAPEAAPPEGDAFFAGLEVLAAALPGLLRAPTVGPASARSAALDDVRSAFRPIVPTIGLANTGVLFVHGYAVEVDAPPARCVAVLLDLAAEQAALSAEEASLVGETTSRQGQRRVARIGLLDMGEGPFRYDFRWTFAASSRRRTDGIHLVRYDFLKDAAPQRVSVFSGVSIVAPRGRGSVVAEVFAVGSTVSPPFFLKGKVSSAVARILTTRAQRLAARMIAR